MNLELFSIFFIICCSGFNFSQSQDSPLIDLSKVRKDVKCFKPCTHSTAIHGMCEDHAMEKFLKVSGSLCLMKPIGGKTVVDLCCNHQLPSSNDQQTRTKLQSDDYENSEDSEERGCGVSSAKFSKIAGGVETDAKEYPWMAVLITRKNSSSPFCGGTLISDRHIITAAHCASRIKVQDLWIRLGEYSFETLWETRAKSFRASEIRIHADFDLATYENDIALVKLLKPTTFSTYVWPVCLPSTIDDSYVGKNAKVIGYGSQYFGGPASPVLMEVNVPILKNLDCQEKYLHRLPDTVMCAGAPGADACQGDSGGPLMIQLPNQRWIVVGITSWGIRCGDARYPGIYTRVNQYIEWIVENAEF